MGTMQLSEFRDELVFNLKNRNDAGLTPARLNRWINQAYLHMCRPKVMRHTELRARYNFSLATGLNEYSLSTPTVGHKILGITDVVYFESATVNEAATRRDLVPRTANYMNKRTKPNGPPRQYAIWGSAGNMTMILDTLPTATENGYQVQVWHYREPDLLTLDTDTTLLSDYWDTVLVTGSQFFAEWFLGYRDLAVASGQIYQNLINETLDDMELNAEDTDHQVEIVNESYMPLPGSNA